MPCYQYWPIISFQHLLFMEFPHISSPFHLSLFILDLNYIQYVLRLVFVGWHFNLNSTSSLSFSIFEMPLIPSPRFMGIVFSKFDSTVHFSIQDLSLIIISIRVKYLPNTCHHFGNIRTTRRELSLNSAFIVQWFLSFLVTVKGQLGSFFTF